MPGPARADGQEPMRARGIVPVGDGPDGFARFAAGCGETAAVLLRELGLAKA